MQLQTYREASHILLAQAFAELGRGDTRQASEKGWGAAAQILKAVAAQRGWEHQSHAAIRRAASQLSRDTEDRDLWRLFRVASDLHTNYYENWDEAETVAYGLRDVESLVEKLEPLLNAAQS